MMLTRLLGARALPYAAGLVAAALLAMGMAISWLWSERNDLITESARHKQALSQAALTNRDNVSTITGLQSELSWRSRRAAERLAREQRRARSLADVTEELREELKHAPCSGPDYLWPDSVYDRMRRNTVSDPNKAGTGKGPRGVPGSPTAPGPEPAGG